MKFEHLWLFMPAMLFVLYVPQMVAGIFIFGDLPAYKLSAVIILGISAYYLVYNILSRLKVPESWGIGLMGRTGSSSQYVVIAISACYFLVIFYAVSTSEKVALWEALSGASADDIAYAREALFKGRSGWERSLIYANAIFSSALMPFALAICYIEKKSYRHVLLVMFALSLLPSLEKVLILKALLPLIILGLNGYFPRRRVMQMAAGAAIVIAGAFFFSKMGETDYLSQNKITIDLLQAQKASLTEWMRNNPRLTEEDRKRMTPAEKQKSSEVESENERIYKLQENIIQKQLDYYIWVERYLLKYNIFGTGQLRYVFNRVFWIPYVTAYDWLGYFHEKLEGKYLFGKTSSLLARITGEAPFPMEREVFKYQFGESGPQTAAANASFLVDAFVNFGWAGVVAYAGLFAALTWVVVVQANPAMQACYYYFVLQASMGGLPGVLFSNGMILLICLAFFVRPKPNLVSH
jgi:hypothetical protein